MEGADSEMFVDPVIFFDLNRLSCHLLGAHAYTQKLPVVISTCGLLLPVSNMETDDVIYLLLLVTTIAVGEFIRRLDSAQLKQTIATAIGIAIVFIVSGFHIFHCVVTAVINALIICFVSPRYINISFLAMRYSE